MFEEGNPFSGLSLSTTALHPTPPPHPLFYTHLSIGLLSSSNYQICAFHKVQHHFPVWKVVFLSVFHSHNAKKKKGGGGGGKKKKAERTFAIF